MSGNGSIGSIGSIGSRGSIGSIGSRGSIGDGHVKSGNIRRWSGNG